MFSLHSLLVSPHNFVLLSFILSSPPPPVWKYFHFYVENYFSLLFKPLSPLSWHVSLLHFTMLYFNNSHSSPFLSLLPPRFWWLHPLVYGLPSFPWLMSPLSLMDAPYHFFQVFLSIFSWFLLFSWLPPPPPQPVSCCCRAGSQWIQPESSDAYKTAYNLPMGDAGTKLDLYYPFFLTVQATGDTLLPGPDKVFPPIV